MTATCITDWLCLPNAHLHFGECVKRHRPAIAPAQSGDVLDGLWRQCLHCDGTGSYPDADHPCPECSGSGELCTWPTT